MTQTWWDRESRLGNCLAVSTLGSALNETSKPMIVAARALNGKYLVRLQDLGAFLLKHGDAVILCHNAGSTHWSIADHLNREGDCEALDVLWQFSSDARLADVGLLDQLVALAKPGIEKGYQTLKELARECGLLAPPDFQELHALLDATMGMPCQALDSPLAVAAVATVDVVWDLYHVLAAKASRIIDEQEIDEGFVDHYGQLSLGVQVQGVIALYQPSRAALQLRRDALDPDSKLLAYCDAVFAACSQKLYANDATWACFHWSAHRLVALDDKGRIRSKKEKLARWLQKTLASQPGLHEIPFEPPRTETGKMALAPGAWVDLAGCHPLIRAWVDLDAAASTRRALHTAGPDQPLVPTYTVFPRVSSKGPDMEQLRDLAERSASPHPDPGPQPATLQPATGTGVWALFEPPVGRSLHVVNLPDLELRCLAEICAASSFGERLAKFFRAGADPIRYLAGRLYEASDQPQAPHLRLRELERDDPARFAGYMAIARAVIHAASRGFAPSQLRNLVPPAVNSDLYLADVDRGSKKTIFFVLPELLGFTCDDTEEVLKKKLKCELNEYTAFLVDLRNVEKTGQVLRKLLAGELQGELRIADWVERLLEFSRDEPWRKRLEARQFGPETYRLAFEQTIMTGLGRVRGGLYFHQAKAAEFLDLADDVRKIVLYEIVRAGYELVGVAGDRFAVLARAGSTPGAALLEAERIQKLVEQSTKEMLVHVPVICQVQPQGA